MSSSEAENEPNSCVLTFPKFKSLFQKCRQGPNKQGSRSQTSKGKLLASISLTSFVTSMMILARKTVATITPCATWHPASVCMLCEGNREAIWNRFTSTPCCMAQVTFSRHTTRVQIVHVTQYRQKVDRDRKWPHETSGNTGHEGIFIGSEVF